jgi:hypothetical protein
MQRCHLSTFCRIFDRLRCDNAIVMVRRLLAWLLRSNRMLGEDEHLRSARRYAAEFRADLAMSSSQATRWETGQIAVDPSVVHRYESMLNLPRLSTVPHEAARRFMNGRTSHLKIRDPDDTIQRWSLTT